MVADEVVIRNNAFVGLFRKLFQNGHNSFICSFACFRKNELDLRKACIRKVPKFGFTIEDKDHFGNITAPSDELGRKLNQSVAGGAQAFLKQCF